MPPVTAMRTTRVLVWLASRVVSVTENTTVLASGEMWVSPASGLAIALAVLAFDAPRGIVLSLRELNWASYGLGVVVISLEVGFLLAYRAGWQVSVAALYSNVAVGLLLIPIGSLLYRETLTISQGAGIVLAVISLILMSR